MKRNFILSASDAKYLATIHSDLDKAINLLIKDYKELKQIQNLQEHIEWDALKTVYNQKLENRQFRRLVLKELAK